MLHFAVVKKRDVAQLLNASHYIGAQCADPTYAFAWLGAGGLFGDAGEPEAAALFAPSAARAWGPSAIELTRLVRSGNVQQPLTKFLAQCFSFIRGKGRFNLVIAYADPSAGHHGGIYQAGNWIYVGMSSSKTIWINRTTGKRSSQRSFDQSTYKQEDGWEKVKTSPKYTYVYPLTKSLRAEWASKSLPFPKPHPAPSPEE